ncbi:MAG: GNAT family N-acetyltransferase [Patescibacteria group bacterium]
MNIRKAELKDIKEILEITKQLHLNMADFVWDTENFITLQIERGDYFVLEDNEKIFGVISLKFRRNGMHIETLAIREGFTSNGYGTELINFAKQFSKDRGAGALRVYSFSEYNILDFYSKNGFKLMDYHGSYDGHKYHCLEMKL